MATTHSFDGKNFHAEQCNKTEIRIKPKHFEIIINIFFDSTLFYEKTQRLQFRLSIKNIPIRERL